MAGAIRSRARLRPLVLDGWPLLLAVLLCLPLLTGRGHPLARDLVFVPRMPLTEAALGLGDGSPRAVPVDGLVALASLLIDGEWLATLVVPLILAAAGWGTRRLVAPLGPIAGAVAGGMAVWNPYVVERLALGQWALLAAYAALPWIILTAGRLRTRRRPTTWAHAVLAVALASLTPTGGLIGSAAALITVCGRGRARLCGTMLVACLVLQLPWLLPALLGRAQKTSDPGGVAAFAAGAEGPGGVLVAVLGMGGVWDAGSVPVSRTTWWGVLTVVVALACLAFGARELRRLDGAARLAVLAGAGLVLALATSFQPGAMLVEGMLERVPGAGLLRDAQKFLAPYAVGVAVSMGASAARLARLTAGHGRGVLVGIALTGLMLPLLLLPDAVRSTWRTVAPIHYPEGFERVAEHLEGEPGDLVTLPWRGYRRFDWGHGQTSSDPALRWFDREVVVSDDLVVGRIVVAGESLRSASLGAALADEPLPTALRDHRITWALVYSDDPDLPDLDLGGLEPVYADDQMALYRVPGAVPEPAGSGRLVRGVVLLGNAGAALLVLAALLRGWRREQSPPSPGDDW